MIQDARTSRHRNKVRLYAGPKFVARDGRWRHIRDVVKIERLAAAVYTVRFDDDWIRLAARGLLPPGTIEQSPESWRQFGPVIDTSKLAVDSLRWDVTYSDPKMVERTPDGWRFKAADGVEIGLFLRDWIKRLGADKVSIDSGGATLDVSHLRGLPGRLDLDPTVVEADSDYAMDGYAAWDVVHAAGGDDEGSRFWVRIVGENEEGEIFRLNRARAEFDTSAYADAIAAVFHVNYSLGVAENPVSPDIHYFVGEANGEPDPFDKTWFAYILGRSAVWDTLGHGTVTAAAPTWDSGDKIGVFVVAAKQFVIGLLDNDYTDTNPGPEWMPGPEEDCEVQAATDDPCYWELTMPGGGGGSRMALTGAGR